MSSKVYKRRRNVAIIIIGVVLAALVFWQANPQLFGGDNSTPQPAKVGSNHLEKNNSSQSLAVSALAKLAIKNSAPKTGYSRNQFGNGWATWGKCDTRQRILARDLTDIKYGTDGCTVLTGTLNDPYTGKIIAFTRGVSTSGAVQIDHVVALSNAWQTGAQDLDKTTRTKLANDDLELIAVDGPANMQKSDSDAAGWLPSNKPFRCEYVARQIAVKIKYTLWVTAQEHDAMASVLKSCPGERLPAP